MFLGKALACYQQLTYLYVATNTTFMSRELEQEESISIEDQRVIGLEATDYILGWQSTVFTYSVSLSPQGHRVRCHIELPWAKILF